MTAGEKALNKDQSIQRPIDVEDGEIYVSFWNNGNFWSVMTEEELMGSQVQGMDMSC